MCAIIGYVGKYYKIEELKESLDKTISRGPDKQAYITKNDLFLGFNRLSIMDLSDDGMQPFENGSDYLVCNGEIYNFNKYKKELIKDGYHFHSNSDCEVLLPLYKKYGVDFVKLLDAEFAFILYDSVTNELIAGRDPIGIRPLFYGYDKNNKIIFASEPKMLIPLSKKIYNFPPAHIYYNGKFIRYDDVTNVANFNNKSTNEITSNIKKLLIAGVTKRLASDAKVGFLLSGGLDSSLVCAIASKHYKEQITTFSIGLDNGAVDLKYARIVASYLNTKHYEFTFSVDDVINNLSNLIYVLGTYDITTIRASIGMYLLCKKIHENTDIKVLLTGEISDELFGYKYTDYAPNGEEFQKESKKRLDELHYYDVLRADRCISANSLEARVPFGDLEFVRYVMAISPEIKLNKYGIGKYLLRKAFDDNTYLPSNILNREKEAFSDGVGHLMVDKIKEYAEKKYTDSQFLILKDKYKEPFGPISKESLLYREIFESFYPNNACLIPSYWMPNTSWEGLKDANDPSARILSNYGKSGD
ncbi:MAG: asparagine synthase B [Acholeplasmatales bacterium]|jgi:asparagine synthase (glutamine-hydrolysing)|nr:asparagine synthase B [Acholeplasmatales bacterium]